MMKRKSGEGKISYDYKTVYVTEQSWKDIKELSSDTGLRKQALVQKMIDLYRSELQKKEGK